MIDTPLIVTLTLNEYEKVFGRMMQSHPVYADKYGYDYVALGVGQRTDLGRECTWLKVILMLAALKSGRDWVMLIDNDTVVQTRCPDFRSVEAEGKFIYGAPGFSGRLNSGVLIVKNGPEAVDFFSLVLGFMRRPLPKADDVGWGENGAVIHVSKRMDIVKLISHKWNNNHQPDLEDYIRHHSAGKMRHQYAFNEAERKEKQRILRGTKENAAQSLDEQRSRLDALYREVCEGRDDVPYYGAQMFFDQADAIYDRVVVKGA